MRVPDCVQPCAVLTMTSRRSRVVRSWRTISVRWSPTAARRRRTGSTPAMRTMRAADAPHPDARGDRGPWRSPDLQRVRARASQAWHGAGLATPLLLEADEFAPIARRLPDRVRRHHGRPRRRRRARSRSSGLSRRSRGPPPRVRGAGAQPPAAPARRLSRDARDPARDRTARRAVGAAACRAARQISRLEGAHDRRRAPLALRRACARHSPAARARCSSWRPQELRRSTRRGCSRPTSTPSNVSSPTSIAGAPRERCGPLDRPRERCAGSQCARSLRAPARCALAAVGAQAPTCRR